MIWQSPSTNVYENIALETHLFKTKAIKGVLFWANTSSVIMGRNQNPWNETHMEKLLESGGLLSRRFSGGGTVYHDLGNLNISFFDNDSKSNHLERIIRVFDGLGVPVSAGSRGELMCLGKKISGSAYYMYKGKVLHHLTLLFNADLSRLWDFLKLEPLPLDTKAVDSVRQPVGNIEELFPHVNQHQFIRAFSQDYGVEPLLTPEPILQEAKELYLGQLKSWSWIFGESPDFTIGFMYNQQPFKVYVKKGHVEKIDLKDDLKEYLGLEAYLNQPFNPNPFMSIANQTM